MSKEQRIDAFKKMANDCAITEGATNDDLAEIFARQIPTTKSGKCIAACLGETIGIVSIWMY